ncbi:hypothetical protein L596_019931 [Steinernema carpocapsae]|uniref:Peptidase A1 domain-containing protein n=1 Tax=Steinernema carpocapsae TaxID=34508 RepID=A0A4V6A0R0_STECR|nr:hypothetical protein L596_019931 [Steinernema carpocapsae]
MKLLLLFLSVAISAAFSIPPGQLPRNPRPVKLVNHYHHPKVDYGIVSEVTQVGSANQVSIVVLDTTSSDMSLNICPGTNTNRNCFAYQASTSYKQLSNNTAKDIVQSAMGVNTEVTFNTKIDPSAVNGGTLGLSPSDTASYPGVTKTQDWWFKKAAKNVFAVWVGKEECQAQVEMGGADLCKRKMPGQKTISLPTTSKNYWQFDVLGAELGGVKASPSQVVISTVKDYIGMPKKFLKEFTSKYSIPWDGLYGAYTVDCGATATLPDLNFQVNGGTLTIRAPVYVYTEHPLPNGKCVLDFEDSKAYGFGPEWYFGLQIIQDYCVSFDFDKKLMGFTDNTVPGGPVGKC